ncbi:hypothetical protein BOTBODRAFT_548180 [Botryobasidium botryosum FD-172 SS1]|uniref:Uncharacterized protein n=1 Tax=Botryobasidium botryosum (strain FD-172 SS1) TaxID=930990 RepID=A0A067MQM7_BOTB1|nr:hypothetical protein BOTBODRAFT_548180 [Botryobasidium botryosum FD-172 SS1]
MECESYDVSRGNASEPRQDTYSKVRYSHVLGSWLAGCSLRGPILFAGYETTYGCSIFEAGYVITLFPQSFRRANGWLGSKRRVPFKLGAVLEGGRFQYRVRSAVGGIEGSRRKCRFQYPLPHRTSRSLRSHQLTTFGCPLQVSCAAREPQSFGVITCAENWFLISIIHPRAHATSPDVAIALGTVSERKYRCLFAFGAVWPRVSARAPAWLSEA